MAGVVAVVKGFAALVVSGAGVKGFLARAAFSIGLSVVASKLFGPKIPKGVGLRARDITTRSALEFRKVVYGEAMVSGPIVFQNVEGANNEYLWTVIPLCWGESEDLVSVHLDSFEIPKADIAWTAGTGGSDGTGTADVSTARWVGANSTEAVAIRYYLGEDAQPVCGALDTAFVGVTTAFRLRGVTHMVLRFLYDADTEEVWKDGIPQNMRALIKGRKVYDPRLDSTNGGSGSHRYTDDTTWEWSDNPALCVADYLVTYMGVAPATSIDWASIADAADDCDVSVDIPTSSTETRFTCNGVLSTGEDHKKNLEALLSSMDGRLTYKNGQWSVRASVWEASSVSLTADDIISDVAVRASAPRSDRFNTIRGFFIDPSRDYQAVEFPHVTASEFTTRDNGVTLDYDLQLPFTNSETMAQRIAFRLLEQGDNQVVAEFTVNKKGANIAAGDVIDLTIDELGWSSKDFRVINWNRQADGSFGLTVREDFSASYADPAEGDYNANSGGSITVPSDVVPPPSGLTATAIQSGIRLDWTNPPGRTFDWIDIYASATSAWGAASLIGSTRSNTFDHTIAAGTTRYYWVRARNFLETESARNPDSDTSSVTTAAGKAAAVSSSTPADGSVTYPGGISTGTVFQSSTDIATAAYTNDLSESVDVQIDYKGLFSLASTELSGLARFATLVVDGDVSYSESTSNYRFSGAVDPETRSRSGSVVLALPAGDSLTARLRIYITAQPGTYNPIPDADYYDVAISVRPIAA